MFLLDTNVISETARKRIGRPRPLADAQIAGIALRHRLTLVTRNAKDFRDAVAVFDPWID